MVASGGRRDALLLRLCSEASLAAQLGVGEGVVEVALAAYHDMEVQRMVLAELEALEPIECQGLSERTAGPVRGGDAWRW